MAKNWKDLLRSDEQSFLTDNQLSVSVDERNPGCDRVHFYPLPFPHEFTDGKWDFGELMRCSSLVVSGPRLDIQAEDSRLSFLPCLIEKEITADGARLLERCAVSENTMVIDWSIPGLSEVTLSFALPHLRAAIEATPNGMDLSVRDEVFAAVRLSGTKALQFEIDRDASQCRAHVVLPDDGKLRVALSFGYDREAASRSSEAAAGNPQLVFQAAEETWDDYFLKIVPHFSCSDRKIEQLYYYQMYIARANMYDIPYEPFTHPYVCPWKTGAIWQWSWNTPLNSVCERWLNDKTIGAGGILLEGDNGGGLNIGSYLRPTRKIAEARRHADFFPLLGACQQGLPPDFDMAVCSTIPHTTPNGLLGAWELYLCSGSEEFLRRALDVMVEAESQFSSHELDNGLCVCAFVDEFDHSLRLKPFIKGFDKSDPAMMNKMDTPFIAIDHNCYLHTLRERIMAAAQTLGSAGVDTSDLRARNAKLKEAINHHLWDETDRFYYDADPRDMSRSGVKCIAGFAALYAGIADAGRAAALVEHLTDPAEFGTPYPCPSVSVDTPDIDPSFITYGGDSMITSGVWFTIEGLIRYGYCDLAVEHMLKALEMVTRDGPSSSYSYHCITGAPNQDKHVLASQSLILTDLLCRYLVGIQPTSSGAFEINPMALPASGIESFTFGPYRYRDRVVTVEWRDGNHQVAVEQLA